MVTSSELFMPPVLSRFRVRLQPPDCVLIKFEPLKQNQSNPSPIFQPELLTKYSGRPLKKE
jgi:hypothetical protein